MPFATIKSELVRKVECVKENLKLRENKALEQDCDESKNRSNVNDVSSTEDRLHDKSKSRCILVMCGVLCIDSATNRRNRRLHEDTGTEVTYRGQPLVNLHRFSDESSTTGSQNAEMDPHRRVMRSTSNVTRNPGETEGAFWGRMIDPTDIERDRAEAIRAAR